MHKKRPVCRNLTCKKFHTFYAKMMIFFNRDTFKLGRLEKRIPIAYTFYESARNLCYRISLN